MPRSKNSAVNYRSYLVIRIFKSKCISHFWKIHSADLPYPFRKYSLLRKHGVTALHNFLLKRDLNLMPLTKFLGATNAC